MRVLLLSFVVPSFDAASGALLVLARQCEHLARDHDLTLVSFAPASREERHSLERLRDAGVESVIVGPTVPPWVIGLKRATQRRFGRRLGVDGYGVPAGQSPAMQKALDRSLARGGHDLLHVESQVLGGYRWSSRLPSVVIEHEVLEEPGGERTPRSTRQRKAWIQADRVQVFTQRDADVLLRVSPEMAGAVAVNPFGVDLPETADSDLEDGHRIVFVGGFRHAPNVDAALWLGSEIMPALLQHAPGARLAIVGDAPPRAVRELAGDAIEVTGRVPSVEPYLSRAAVVVAPVRQGGGMRVKVLQAMAHGKAVVTTPLGAEGLHTDAGPAPVVVARGVEEIATALAGLLADAARRRMLGVAARAFVARHHSWSAYADRLSALYEDAVANRRMGDPRSAPAGPEGVSGRASVAEGALGESS